MRGTLLASLVLALGFCTVVSGQNARDDKTKTGPEMLVGKDAPNFTPDFALNGNKATLADLKGKVVLVDFWAVWCGPCIAVFPKLRDWHEKYNKKGLEVVGLTRYYDRYEDFKDGKLVRAKGKATQQQEQEVLKKFVAHHKLPYRIQTVAPTDFTEYKVRAIPTAVLIDRQGKVAMVKIGSGAANAKALEAKIRELLGEKD